MLWARRLMAAALGEVRIKVRNCVIAMAARKVYMAVRAPVMRKHAFQLFLEEDQQRLCHRNSRSYPYAFPKCCALQLPRQFGEVEPVVFARDIVPKTLALFLKRSTKEELGHVHR